MIDWRTEPGKDQDVLYLTSPTSLSMRPDAIAMISSTDLWPVRLEQTGIGSLSAGWVVISPGTTEAFGTVILGAKPMKTELAKQLMAIRRRYVESGGRLLDKQAIENWIESMRRR
jgi:hypothetical protein